MTSRLCIFCISANPEHERRAGNVQREPLPFSLQQARVVENIRLLEKHVGACFFGTDFEVGNSVFVKEGPLTGLRGVIDRLDHKKLHIHVDAIPGSVMIDVEPHQVQLEKDTLYSLITSR